MMSLHNSSKGHPFLARRTLGYCLMFACLGFQLGVIGPTLHSLGEQTKTSLEDMGFVFLASSIGFTLGTPVGGWIFDKVKGHPILALCNFIGAGLLATLPLFHSFIPLLFLFAAKGLVDGIVSVGTNTLMIWSHREKSAPFMNALHFCFGVGAFVSPLIFAKMINLEINYVWIFWCLAALQVLVAIFILTLKENPTAMKVAVEKDDLSVKRSALYSFVISSALFLFFYVGAEIAVGGWIYTYAVSYHLAAPAYAAYLTSGFWFAFTMGRMFAILLGARVTPKSIVITALIGSLMIIVLWMIFPKDAVLIWIVTLALGFVLGPIWPTGYTMAGQSLRLTAAVSGLILLGDSFGCMLLPLLAGKVMAASTASALIYLVFGSLALSFLSFISMVRCKKELVFVNDR